MTAKKRRQALNNPRPSSFDGIANKFDSNIYGTSKGHLRHQLLLHYLKAYLAKPQLSVLDAGGGTGVMSREFAQAGHKVMLADVSKDVLDIGEQRLQEFSSASVVLSSLSDIKGQFDLILCHAVLEWLDDPEQCIAHLLSLLPENGVLSLSFFNQDAKIFNNLLYGNFDYVKSGMPAKNTVRLNPHNAQKPTDIIAFIDKIPNVSIIKMAGIRCIHDYMLDKTKIEENYEELFEMECQYGAQAPYMWLGKYFYMQIKKHA